MSNTELKPCPFCGGQAEMVGINNGNPFYVVCECCGLEFGHPDYGKEHHYHEIIKAWNTRKPMDKIVEQLEEEKARANRHYNFGEVISYKHAIEIVRGVSDE